MKRTNRFDRSCSARLEDAINAPAGADPVAQIGNLLYRRIAFGKALKCSKGAGETNARQIENPRYGRLKICATVPGSAHVQRRRIAAFTLIELLVVIAIIGILAALIFPAIGGINRRKQLSLAQAQMQSIAQAIEGYHTKLGYYPPDNPNNAVTNELYFELLGTTNNATGAAGTALYGTLDASAQITPTLILQYFNVRGFANTSTRAHSDDQGSAASTFLNHLLPNQVGQVDPANPQILILVCPVPWPSGLSPMLSASPTLNPWCYNSSHPTNNVGTYDLWVDIVIGHHTNRVCNWSAQPVQL